MSFEYKQLCISQHMRKHTHTPPLLSRKRGRLPLFSNVAMQGLPSVFPPSEHAQEEDGEFAEVQEEAQLGKPFRCNPNES